MLFLKNNFKVMVQCLKLRRFYGTNDQRKVGIFGVPSGKGQKEAGIKTEGLQKAPEEIRKLNLNEKLNIFGFIVNDYGNICYKPLPDSCTVENMHNYNHVAPLLEQVSLATSKVLKENNVCLTLGGDHSLAAATIHGHLKVEGPDNVAVLYIDAHSDINTAKTSLTGNIHGMPISMISKELDGDWPKLSAMEWLDCKMSLKNVGFIGLRSVDPAEARFLENYQVHAFSMEKVDQLGIEQTVDDILKAVDPEHVKSIHLSIDVDSMDPAEAPSTTVPVRGGLSLREVVRIAEKVYSTGRLRAIDLVEFNPLVDKEGGAQKTLEAIEHILLACFGNRRRGNSQQM